MASPDWTAQDYLNAGYTPAGGEYGGWNPPPDAAQQKTFDDNATLGAIGATGNAGAFRDTLNQISNAAGLQNFDWSKYEKQLATERLNDPGYDNNWKQVKLEEPWGEWMQRIVESAAAENPQIGQVWQQAGQQVMNQWNQYGQQLDHDQSVRREQKDKFATMAMAAPFAAGGLAALAGGAGAAGAASEGAALAGSASTPSMAAGAGGALGTVPSGLGAYYSGGAGITAAEEAAMLGASGGGSAGGAAAGGGSALQNIIGGSGGTSDWLKLAGQAAPGILGMIGSNQQTKAMEGLAGQYMAMGQPYRDLALKYEQNPQAYFDSPQSQEMLRQMGQSISKDVGNPAGSPYGQTLLLQGLANQFGQNQQRLGNMGGLSAYNSAAPGASQSAINSGANQWNAFGSAAGNVLNPPTPLAELYKQYRTAAGMV